MCISDQGHKRNDKMALFTFILFLNAFITIEPEYIYYFYQNDEEQLHYYLVQVQYIHTHCRKNVYLYVT